MERMDMHSRNEYLKVLRERYLEAITKKEKSRILDEYCANTGQVRKYVIRKIQPGVDLKPKQRKKRKEIYDGQAGKVLPRYCWGSNNYKVDEPSEDKDSVVKVTLEVKEMNCPLAARQGYTAWCRQTFSDIKQPVNIP